MYNIMYNMANKPHTIMNQEDTKTCRHCGLTLPLNEFERLPTGTYRRVCRRCKYVLYDYPNQVRRRQRCQNH